ncbi:holo-[acyl-carrier-protein] synthase [Pseudodesulfovibrio sediminis]|uniref:Holo-[acyl-carrier-protein] synthase n=1 Tax=Pseudodesulfovibrio sediminis TaxID=2810563 RepID=A0ABN6EPD7_9BACT|nr:holo-[acyl-carrier-protein] synthase [Pseudodesulfovibrio sediminis]BCS87050.1 holo-[acyl-carrier-protein] synthase [Pseudodesulfovibrio sediminis]
MIKGIGLDLAELDRIKALWEQYGSRFAKRILTDNEIRQLPEHFPINRLAALFAGKEAAVKALGTGFSQGIHFKCIEILHGPSGKPEIAFLGRGREECEKLGVTSAHITLTHSRDTAAATVILEG